MLDFLGQQFISEHDLLAGGVLIIDEIEQHLHPRWQRHVFQRIRTQFPHIQLIATTHTPLAIGGAIDIPGGQLVHLSLDGDNAAQGRRIVGSDLEGMRSDQILTSSLFGLDTSRTPGTERRLNRYAELISKASLTTAEESEFERIAASIGRNLPSAEEKKIGRAVFRLIQNALDSLVEQMDPVKAQTAIEEARMMIQDLVSGKSERN